MDNIFKKLKILNEDIKNINLLINHFITEQTNPEFESGLENVFGDIQQLSRGLGDEQKYIGSGNNTGGKKIRLYLRDTLQLTTGDEIKQKATASFGVSKVDKSFFGGTKIELTSDGSKLIPENIRLVLNFNKPLDTTGAVRIDIDEYNEKTGEEKKHENIEVEILDYDI